MLQHARKLRRFLWTDYHAKRLECVQLAGAVIRRGCFESGGKLHALQTLRAVRLRLWRAALHSPFHPHCHLAAACLLAALVFLAAAARAQTGSPDLWQRQSIYQIITDRFFDGDPANNNADGNYDPSGHRGTSVHGGDFKGVDQKLDYIKALGAPAIWISPVVLNARGEFHGYAGLDFYKVDPHWGSLADLQHMVRAAHARGLLVIDDIVVNHGGNLVDSGDRGYPYFKRPPDGYTLRWRNHDRQYPPPFNLNATNTTLSDLFHNSGHIRDYSDSAQVEQGELSGLHDFRSVTISVREGMIGI